MNIEEVYSEYTLVQQKQHKKHENAHWRPLVSLKLVLIFKLHDYYKKSKS